MTDRIIFIYFFFFVCPTVASPVDDVHVDTVPGRVRVHIRGTRRVGVQRQEPDARHPGSRHHHAGLFPADIRRVPAAPGLVQETDIQLDPLAGRKRRSHILQ